MIDFFQDVLTTSDIATDDGGIEDLDNRQLDVNSPDAVEDQLEGGGTAQTPVFPVPSTHTTTP